MLVPEYESNSSSIVSGRHEMMMSTPLTVTLVMAMMSGDWKGQNYCLASPATRLYLLLLLLPICHRFRPHQMNCSCWIASAVPTTRRRILAGLENTLKQQ